MRNLKNSWEIGWNVATTAVDLVIKNWAAKKVLLDPSFLAIFEYSGISFNAWEISLLKRLKDRFDVAFGWSHGASLAIYVLTYVQCKVLETNERDLNSYGRFGIDSCFLDTPGDRIVGFCRNGAEFTPSPYFFNIQGDKNRVQFCRRTDMPSFRAEEEFRETSVWSNVMMTLTMFIQVPIFLWQKITRNNVAAGAFPDSGRGLTLMKLSVVCLLMILTMGVKVNELLLSSMSAGPLMKANFPNTR